MLYLASLETVNFRFQALGATNSTGTDATFDVGDGGAS